MLTLTRTLPDDADCPCGGGHFAQCCGPLLAGRALPSTAEACMRSRYTAFALHEADHLFRTWHPRTRPEPLDAGALEWHGLRIVGTVDGGPDDVAGQVEFEATWRAPDGTTGTLREVSSFEKRGRRWVYVDGDVNDAQV